MKHINEWEMKNIAVYAFLGRVYELNTKQFMLDRWTSLTDPAVNFINPFDVNDPPHLREQKALDRVNNSRRFLALSPFETLDQWEKWIEREVAKYVESEGLAVITSRQDGVETNRYYLSDWRTEHERLCP